MATPSSKTPCSYFDHLSNHKSQIISPSIYYCLLLWYVWCQWNFLDFHNKIMFLWAVWHKLWEFQFRPSLHSILPPFWIDLFNTFNRLVYIQNALPGKEFRSMYHTKWSFEGLYEIKLVTYIAVLLMTGAKFVGPSEKKIFWNKNSCKIFLTYSIKIASKFRAFC